MSAAIDIRGLKRVCVECGVRFYDMNKRPIICPNCKTEFSNQPKIKGRNKLVKDDVVKSKLVVPDTLDENEDEISLSDDSDLNLDDVAAMEDSDDDVDDEDALGLDDEDLGDLDIDGLDDLDDEDLDDLDSIDEEEEDN